MRMAVGDMPGSDFNRGERGGPPSTRREEKFNISLIDQTFSPRLRVSVVKAYFIRRFFSFACIFFGLFVLLSCSGRPWPGFPTQYDPQRVWPGPPEPPLVAHLLDIRQQKDLFQTGGLLRSLGEWVAGKVDSTMVRPYSIALHPAGLLVTDPGRGLVHFYNWNKRRYIPIGPKRKEGLSEPIGVAALADGRILVCDSRLRRVAAFDAKGRPLGDLIAEGLARPAGLAVSETRDEIYVSDALEHCIKVYDLQGRRLRALGRRGDGPGEFNFPTHLALDGAGRLLVTDFMNFRVQIMTPEGKFVCAFGKLGDAPGSFSKPKGVATDTQGNAIVVEGLHGALQFFNEAGQLLLSLGETGAGPGQFYLPAGLCCDRQNNLLFVADSYNRRVQVFRLLMATTEAVTGEGSIP